MRNARRMYVPWKIRTSIGRSLSPLKAKTNTLDFHEKIFVVSHGNIHNWTSIGGSLSPLKEIRKCWTSTRRFLSPFEAITWLDVHRRILAAPRGNYMLNLKGRIFSAPRGNYMLDLHWRIFAASQDNYILDLYWRIIVALYEIICWTFTEGSLSPLKEIICLTLTEGSFLPLEEITMLNLPSRIPIARRGYAKSAKTNSCRRDLVSSRARLFSKNYA